MFGCCVHSQVNVNNSEDYAESETCRNERSSADERLELRYANLNASLYREGQSVEDIETLKFR
jgi:hypothetical protein